MAQFNQFVGYTDLQSVGSGFAQLVRVTDFSHPACDVICHDIRTRERTIRPRGQVFVVNDREFRLLHNRGEV